MSRLAGLAERGKPATVVVCVQHKKTGAWKVKEVGENRLVKELARGALLPGDDVPGMEGYRFDADCVPEPIPAGVIAWEGLTPLPIPVRAAAAATDGSRIYVLGGNEGYSTWSANNQIYDPGTDTWTLGAPFGTGRDFGMAVGMTDGIHLLGGAGPGLLDDHQVYDPATDSWGTRAPMPVAMNAGEIHPIGSSIYVIGNRSGPVMIYDMGSDSWTTGASIPTVRFSAASGVIGGKIYVAGGQIAGLIRETDVLEVYDPIADSWATLTPMPVALEAIGGGVLDGELCVFGGRVAVASPTGNAQSETYCYNVASDAWRAEADMITPRVEIANVELGGMVYAMGGRDPGAYAVSAAERLVKQ
jgi:N-acetylneuraminic acid mutarotase